MILQFFLVGTFSFSISFIYITLSLLCSTGLARPYFERMYEPERLSSFDSILGSESFAAPVDAGGLNSLYSGLTDKNEDEERGSKDESPTYPLSTRTGRGRGRVSSISSLQDADLHSHLIPQPIKADEKSKLGADRSSGQSIVRFSSPLSVRGATAVDQLAAVPVFGVDRGLPGFFTPSLSSTSVSSSSPIPSTSFTSSFPSTDSTSIPPMSVSIPLNSLPSSHQGSNSNSIINYDAFVKTDEKQKVLTDSSVSASQHLNRSEHQVSNTAARSNDSSTPSSGLTNITSSYGSSDISDNVDIINSGNSIQVSSQNSLGGFQLSKYVRDIGLRARSLVGGLLKREDGAVQVCALL